MAWNLFIKTTAYSLTGLLLGAGAYAVPYSMVTGRSIATDTVRTVKAAVPVTALGHHQTYTVTFRDPEARKLLSSYVATGLKQINELPEMRKADITFKVSEKNRTVSVPATENETSCGDANELIFGLREWADGSNVSFSNVCRNLTGTAGGTAWINKAYWTADLLPKEDIKNVVTHELGHLLGLHHPHNKCNKVSPTRPIMCAALPAYEPGDSIGLFREDDLSGIRHLINDRKEQKA